MLIDVLVVNKMLSILDEYFHYNQIYIVENDIEYVDLIPSGVGN